MSTKNSHHFIATKEHVPAPKTQIQLINILNKITEGCDCLSSAKNIICSSSNNPTNSCIERIFWGR